MSSSVDDLIKAIRAGRLKDVVKVLDSGALVALDGGQGDSGLPLAIACFMGHADIVRELALRGAKINFKNNSDPASPLSMALRGKKTEVVKVLIELGVDIPPNTDVGLTSQELQMARWKAQHFGIRTTDTGGVQLPELEEIQMTSLVGTDTDILDAEMRKAIAEMEIKRKSKKH